MDIDKNILKVVPASGEYKFSSQEKQGYIYAIRLLTLTKRSERDIRAKLADKGYPEQAIEKILSILKKENYINDLAFAKQKIDYAVYSKPMGKKRLEYELKLKGIQTPVIQEALNDFDLVREKELAKKMAEIKYEEFRCIDPEKRKKRVYDFLVRRGFNYEICRHIVYELIKN